MIDITFIILTKNEELNIFDCLKSIEGFARRVVIVDSFSSDNTVAIAKNMNVDVYQHPFETYARQFNWALDNTGITTKWVFRLDADERLTPDLCAELCTLAHKHQDDDVNGITFEADLFFMGKQIRHGGSQKRKLMMFKNGLARVEDRRMDEHTELLSGRSVNASGRFLHYDFKNLTHWVNKMNWYATREMQDYYEFKNGKSFELNASDIKILKTRQKKFGFYYKLPMFLRAFMLFIYIYIFRLGFLDGKEGFVFHFMYHCWYRAMVDAKILEQAKSNKPFEETGDLK